MKKSKNVTNNIVSLRDQLFNTLERLLDKKNPMDSQQARSIANVGRVIVDSAKIELEFMKSFGVEKGTTFILPSPEVIERLN